MFDLNSEYWELWNKRKEEFFNAFIIDHKTHAISSYEDFENLADWKSALGKLAIDALYLISPQFYYRDSCCFNTGLTRIIHAFSFV